MRPRPVQIAFAGTWRRSCHAMERVRAWLANPGTPYSPLSCMALLATLGLIIHIGR
jgi:hypothetical protein